MYQAFHEKNMRQYDRLHIELEDGTEEDVYFDITDFYGKWQEVEKSPGL